MILTPTCPTRDQIEKLLLGELSQRETEALWQHIDTCGACESIAEEIEVDGSEVVSALRIERAGAGSAVAPPNLERLKLIPSILRSVRKMPRQVGSYELLSEIGRGGMGIVYLARQIHFGRNCAVKLLSVVNSSELVERFKTEIVAIGQLEHPSIVCALDAGSIDDEYFLAMEYLAGPNVGQLVDRLGPLPQAAACRIVLQAAEGIAYAHAKGIVHRDIKPSNLILDESGNTKVVDFGLAFAYEWNLGASLTSTGCFLGTLEYAAPEQVGSNSDAKPSADIYSLGATLYHLLSGRPPLNLKQCSSPVETLAALQERRIVSLRKLRPDLPKALVLLVRNMLAKNPRNRPNSADIIVQHLKPFAGGSQEVCRLLELWRSAEPMSSQLAVKSVSRRASSIRAGRARATKIARISVLFLLAVCAVVGSYEFTKGRLVFDNEVVGITLSILSPDGSERKLDLAEATQELRLSSGKYRISLVDNSDASIQISSQLVEISRFSTTVVRVFNDPFRGDFDKTLELYEGEKFIGKRFDKNTSVADEFELHVLSVSGRQVDGFVLMASDKRRYDFQGEVESGLLRFDVHGTQDAVAQSFVARRRGSTLILDYKGTSANSFPCLGRVALEAQ